jgi:hypothetical protein
MAYFNHAFQKVFLGTEGFTGLGEGQLGTTGNIFAAGEFGFVDPKTWTIQNPASAPTNCCPLVLVSGSVLQNDKIGPFHGGYLESNKSKMINPRYVNKFYRVDPCEPTQAVLNIGVTPFTQAQDPEIPNCCPDFLCGETYSLRIDVKGSPALRFLNHNAYLTVSAYTGCCPEGAIAPTPVDSTLVMIEWAKQIIDSPLISPFILPVVSAADGTIYYAPGTVDTLGNPVANTWDTYVSPGFVEGDCAGLILYGAYVDTKFGNCTFQISDFYEKEPVRLYASEVDYNGDPCAFSGICIVNECLGTQAMGLGESAVRDLILSESYRQNFFHSDFRIREITQGYDILNQINRNANVLYTRYYLLHSVPRHNNPTGTFDNDQYLLEIITDGDIPQFETFVNDWTVNCSNCEDFEVFDCVTECTPEVPPVPNPLLIG